MRFFQILLQNCILGMIITLLLLSCRTEVTYLEQEELDEASIQGNAVVIWHTRIIDQTKSRDGHFPYYSISMTDDMHTGGFQQLYHQDKSSPVVAARVKEGWVPREDANYFNEIIITLLKPGAYSVDGIGLAVGSTAAGSVFNIYKSYDFAAGRLYHMGVYNLELTSRIGDAYNYRLDVFQNPSIVEEDLEEFRSRFPDIYEKLKDRVSTIN